MEQTIDRPTGQPATPAGVVAAADALLAELGEMLWSARTSEELVDVVPPSSRSAPR